jgi:acyl-CoA synthetase (NDP forming)
VPTAQFGGEFIDGLLAPRAMTIVGASPNGYLTEHLLRNVANHTCRFRGDVNLVNPGYRRLFGRVCVPSVAQLTGEIGVLYLLVSLKDCMAVLDALPSRPQGVVVFAEASPPGAPVRYEDDIAAWGREHGVPALGPQSNGLLATTTNCLGFVVPIVEDIAAGNVALLAQSGGILGGMVKYFGQHHVGMYAALEYGTGCMLSMETLGRWLLERDQVRVVAVYADGVGSVSEFAAMLRRADELGKTVVFMIGGSSDAGRRAAASHSGMATTPRAVLRGLARQFHAVAVDTLDEVVWSVEALTAVGYRRHPGRGVALFSDSGGGTVVMADALAAAGITLAEPLPGTKERLGITPGTSANPMDFGSASMGQNAAINDATATLAVDEQYGICAYASILGIPRHEQSVHLGQLADFAATVTAAGKLAFIASTLPFRPNGTLIDDAVVGLGSVESAAKLRALGVLGDPTAHRPAERPPAEATEDAVPTLPPVTGADAVAELAELPLTWPVTLICAAATDVTDTLAVPFPVVAKSEAGLPHRAKVGGVLHGIADARVLRSAVAYLVDRFGGPVSVSETVPHDEAYFVGAYRDGDVLALLFGPGGSAAEQHAEVRVAPATTEALREAAEPHAGAHAEQLALVLLALQEWMLARPDVESVDLNPLVVRSSDEDACLVALDAKIQRSAP